MWFETTSPLSSSIPLPIFLLVLPLQFTAGFGDLSNLLPRLSLLLLASLHLSCVISLSLSLTCFLSLLNKGGQLVINNDGGLSRLGHWGQISPKELGPAPFAVECRHLRWRKRVTDHSGGGART